MHLRLHLSLPSFSFSFPSPLLLFSPVFLFSSSLLFHRLVSSLCFCVACSVLCCVCGVVCGVARWKPARRSHVYNVWTCCRYTRGRFECAHGSVLNPHTGRERESGGKRREREKKTVLTCTRGSPTVTTWSCPFKAWELTIPLILALHVESCHLQLTCGKLCRE